MAGYGAPSVYLSTALATPIVPVAWDDTVTPAEGFVQPIQVGYLLQLTIRAFDGDITDAVEVLVDSDQGAQSAMPSCLLRSHCPVPALRLFGIGPL